MRAYTDCTHDKTHLVNTLKAHQAADEIIQGNYWDATTHRGCLVGCAVHSGDHMLFEPLYAIPWHVAFLADQLFECLTPEECRSFPVTVADAISTGANLDRVYDAWCSWMLNDPQFGMVAISDVDPSVRSIGALFARAAAGDEPGAEEWTAAEQAARAARAAWAAWAARDARAAWAARDARAAWAARDAWAAWAARDARAAWAAWAAWAARAARAAWAAWAARDARAASWSTAAAAEFIRLLSESKP